MACRCCLPAGCGGGGRAQEPWVRIVDLCLVEAATTSVKLGFRLARARGAGGGRLLLQQRSPLEVRISVLGGPQSDLHGPRSESVVVPKGRGKVLHEVSGLNPETEYTVIVALVWRTGDGHGATAANAVPGAAAGAAGLAAGESPRSGGCEERLEVRTTAAPGGVLLPEDLCSCAGKDEKGGKVAQGPGHAPGGSEQVGAASAPVASAAEEISTVAPSDTESWDAQSDEEGSPMGGVPPEAPMRSAAGPALEPAAGECPEEEDVPTKEMVLMEEGSKHTVQCNLCSLLNLCLQRRAECEPSVPAPATVHTFVAAPAVQRRPGKRPYRIPFPGIPVDPASVGLQHLATANEELLAAQIAARIAAGAQFAEAGTER